MEMDLNISICMANKKGINKYLVIDSTDENKELLRKIQ